MLYKYIMVGLSVSKMRSSICYNIIKYQPAPLTLTDTVQYANHFMFWIPRLGSKIDLTLVWNSDLSVCLSLHCNLNHLASA